MNEKMRNEDGKRLSRRQFSKILGGAFVGLQSNPIAAYAAGVERMSSMAASSSQTEDLNSREFRGTVGGLPEGWQVQSPRSVLTPKFHLVKRFGGGLSLAGEGNGRRECFGYIHSPVSLEAGKYYRMRVELEADGLDDLNRNLLHGVFGKEFNDGIFNYHRRNGLVIGETCFPGPDKSVEADIRLYFRFSANGRVVWNSVSVEECDPIPSRLVAVACRHGGMPEGAGMSYWGTWLDRVGRAKTDIALLPEMYNGKSPSGAEPLHGPAGDLLASKARQWHMYTCASFYEKRGELVYNTAPLFDREGKLVGKYEKFYPYDPELDEGVTPGSHFPVFDTDFGKVGIMICYDSWFPEVARMLRLNGAELVLFPSAGYYADLMPARTADNGLWIAASSLDGPAGIWDSGGARAGEAMPSPTRHVASSIQDYSYDPELQMATARIDLTRRLSPHWWGGPMGSAPGGRRVRRTSIEPIEDLIAHQARQWWT
jgi:predicted amidohydrolase